MVWQAMLKEIPKIASGHVEAREARRKGIRHSRRAEGEQRQTYDQIMAELDKQEKDSQVFKDTRAQSAQMLQSMLNDPSTIYSDPNFKRVMAMAGDKMRNMYAAQGFGGTGMEMNAMGDLMAKTSLNYYNQRMNDLYRYSGNLNPYNAVSNKRMATLGHYGDMWADFDLREGDIRVGERLDHHRTASSFMAGQTQGVGSGGGMYNFDTSNAQTMDGGNLGDDSYSGFGDVDTGGWTESVA